jgi:hypothetical protein
MQKWEYAYIRLPQRGDMLLVYLHPSGRKFQTYDKYKYRFEQLYDWITTLGQEGYEMTGVTAINETQIVTAEPNTYTYWFKRPIT